jgi:uncharacterized membrane protein YgdD (TMEM256/DUF423 family)
MLCAMNERMAVRVAAISGLLAVGLGAFGAHGLAKTLNEFQTAAIWEKAVLYHFVHTLALLFLAGRNAKGPFLCFLAGIVIFSGSLYLLAATDIRKLGAVTPLGGVSFLAGWLWLILAPPEKR